jgi:hypothetical protein
VVGSSPYAPCWDIRAATRRKQSVHLDTLALRETAEVHFDNDDDDDDDDGKNIVTKAFKTNLRLANEGGGFGVDPHKRTLTKEP